MFVLCDLEGASANSQAAQQAKDLTTDQHQYMKKLLDSLKQQQRYFL